MNVPFVLDPVFICDKSRYNKLIEQGNKITGIAKYVLDTTPEKEQVLNEIANKNGYKINTLEDAAIVSDKLPMEDWLAAIATSDFVVSDSFHGTCFAIIFNKPFITFANKERGLARFKLLEEFNLSNRLVYSLNDFEKRKEEILAPIDWEYVNSKISELKIQSLDILKEAIEPKKKETSDYDILNDKYLELENKINYLLSRQESQNGQRKEFLKKLFSKTRSADGTHRIVKILGITIKQRRRIKRRSNG